MIAVPVHGNTIFDTRTNAALTEFIGQVYRMPAILEPADYPKWFGEQPATPQELLAMLRPHPAEKMEVVPISTKVNNVKNEGPDLVEPISA